MIKEKNAYVNVRECGGLDGYVQIRYPIAFNKV